MSIQHPASSTQYPPLLLAVILVLVLVFSPSFTLNAYAETHEADFVPWSGYWWPFNMGGLATGIDYRGHPAPLEKYDLLENGFYNKPATAWYLDTFYDPDTDFWWGECGDWASAAVYEHITFFPSSEDNIIFRVGDKKGLMTHAHNNDMVVSRDVDTRPEEFHYWLLNYIKDQGKAFVADLDPGVQVWSYPIYKYDMNETRNAGKTSVSVKIYFADDMVSPDYRGTQVKTETYTYDLFLDASGDVIDGQWTGNSVTEHPDRLMFPLSQGTNNPDLDYNEVLRLAHSKDDFLEDGQKSVDISPGTYNLVLMDEDVYQISCATGDTIRLDLEKKSGSDQDITAVLTDGNGHELETATVSETSPMQLVLTAQDPPYFLSLIQSDYSDPNIYTLILDLKKQFMQQIPYLPKNGMWSGFALANPEDVPQDGIILTAYNEAGDPVQTVLGPMSLEPGEKYVFFFSDLSWRDYEYPDLERLTLLSDRPANLINIQGYGEDRIAAFVQGDRRGKHLVIPDVKGAISMDGYMSGGIINEAMQDVALRIQVYTADGDLFTSDNDETLAMGEKLPIVPGSQPFFSMPQGGWMDIKTVEDVQISGYQSLNSLQRIENLFALPVRAGQKIVPHVPPPDAWITRVTLINPNDGENQIEFHPALAGENHDQDLALTLGPQEKRVVEIQDWFGWTSGDPLYHSVIQVDGTQPFVGYYTYAASSGQGDEASLPLLEETDYQSVLVLPHCPGTSIESWWTGLGIFNPAAVEETIRIEPYDENGNLMETLVQYITLDSGAYEVKLVQSLGGAEARDISFIKFVVQAPQGKIGGFYLYGNRSNGIIETRMLSGANM